MKNCSNIQGVHFLLVRFFAPYCSGCWLSKLKAVQSMLSWLFTCFQFFIDFGILIDYRHTTSMSAKAKRENFMSCRSMSPSFLLSTYFRKILMTIFVVIEGDSRKKEAYWFFSWFSGSSFLWPFWIDQEHNMNEETRVWTADENSNEIWVN